MCRYGAEPGEFRECKHPNPCQGLPKGRHLEADAAKYALPSWATIEGDCPLYEVEPCNTDCPRYRQGDCPYNYKEKRTKCPRWRGLM